MSADVECDGIAILMVPRSFWEVTAEKTTLGRKERFLEGNAAQAFPIATRGWSPLAVPKSEVLFDGRPRMPKGQGTHMNSC